MYAAVAGKDSHRWWCWVFVGPETTVFRIAPSRSLKVLTEQLGIEVDADTGALPDALPGGRELLLSSDFYVVYQCADVFLDADVRHSLSSTSTTLGRPYVAGGDPHDVLRARLSAAADSWP